MAEAGALGGPQLRTQRSGRWPWPARKLTNASPVGRASRRKAIGIRGLWRAHSSIIN